MRLKMDWKSFAFGVGALVVGLIVPGLSETIINIIAGLRDTLPFSKKK